MTKTLTVQILFKSSGLVTHFGLPVTGPNGYMAAVGFADALNESVSDMEVHVRDERGDVIVTP